MKKLVIVLLMLMNAACSSTTYVPLNPPNAGEARVYIIREYAEPTAWNIWVDVDKKRVASLSNKSYVAFSTSLGEKRLVLDWPPMASSLTIFTKVDLTESRNYYFIVTGSVNTAYERLKLKSISEEDAMVLMERLNKG